MNDQPPVDQPPVDQPPVDRSGDRPVGDDLARPEIRPRRTISLIWAIPLLAAVIAAWLAYRTISQEGPTITITFLTADGLTAGQTRVRHKAVDLGTVRSITLSPDMSHVVVKVEMRREAEPVLTDQARFWVVRPRLNAGDISGLETIVSGAYIELDPGKPDEHLRDHFTGLETPPAVRSDEPGTTFTLNAYRVGQLGTGAPVFYRDSPVGEVLNLTPGSPGKPGTVHVFVRAPFDKYVRDGSYFWRASGLSLSTGNGGLHIEIESLQALLSGAIAFDTPKEAMDTPVAKQDTSFFLFSDKDTAASSHFREHIDVIARFKDNAGGITIGSPVQMYGIRVGYVAEVKLQYDPQTNQISVPMHLVLQPERLFVSGPRPDASQNEQRLAQMVQEGLRAEIKTSNLLTGSQAIALEFEPDAPKASLTKLGDEFVLPTTETADLDELTRSLSEVSVKLDKIPFAEIGKNLNTTLAGLSQVANGQQLQSTLASVSASLQSIQDLVQKVDNGATPLLQRLPTIADNLQGAVDRANKLFGSLNAGYGSNSEFSRELERLLSQLSDTARSVRNLANLLDEHPEALIRGRTGGR